MNGDYQGPYQDKNGVQNAYKIIPRWRRESMKFLPCRCFVCNYLDPHHLSLDDDTGSFPLEDRYTCPVKVSNTNTMSVLQSETFC